MDSTEERDGKKPDHLDTVKAARSTNHRFCRKTRFFVNVSHYASLLFSLGQVGLPASWFIVPESILTDVHTKIGISTLSRPEWDLLWSCNTYVLRPSLLVSLPSLLPNFTLVILFLKKDHPNCMSFRSHKTWIYHQLFWGENFHLFSPIPSIHVFLGEEWLT